MDRTRTQRIASRALALATPLVLAASAAAQGLTVMPTGDSRVHGNPPNHHSYR